MTPFSRMRRFAISATALFLAALLFRTQISEALVVRGDEYLSHSQTSQALERYRRALVFQPNMESAADRYVFASMEVHTQRSVRDALSAATQFLRRHPGDSKVLADRGLCYLTERRYGLASTDFKNAARLSQDPQTYVFAGWSALRSGSRSGAIALWKEAERLQPRYQAARIALAEYSR